VPACADRSLIYLEKGTWVNLPGDLPLLFTFNRSAGDRGPWSIKTPYYSTATNLINVLVCVSISSSAFFGVYPRHQNEKDRMTSRWPRKKSTPQSPSHKQIIPYQEAHCVGPSSQISPSGPQSYVCFRSLLTVRLTESFVVSRSCPSRYCSAATECIQAERRLRSQDPFQHGRVWGCWLEGPHEKGMECEWLCARPTSGTNRGRNLGWYPPPAVFPSASQAGGRRRIPTTALWCRTNGIKDGEPEEMAGWTGFHGCWWCEVVRPQQDIYCTVDQQTRGEICEETQMQLTCCL